MKIILLTSSLTAGGAERVATTLCNAWATRGDQVTLIPTFSGGGHQPFYRISDAVELIYLADVVGIKKNSVGSYAQRLFALRRLIVERRPDVIISFLENVNVAAILASPFLRIPLIICERNDPSSEPRSKFWEFACRLTYRYADMLTVQTEAVARKVMQIYPRLKQVRSIPNPLPGGIAAIAKSGLYGRRKTLLSLGRLVAQKQINIIINAFAEIAPHFEEWDLQIYGEGPLKIEIEEQIYNLGLQGRVFLKGLTTEPWQIMADADVFVMASKYEGFPNALLEAMSVGLPCVVFDCPSGPREITSNGKYAMLVKLDDQNGLIAALEKIMSDESFGVELGNQARASILLRYSLSAVLDRWDQLFREVGVII
jgi:GalNAc-alpha-(1->4)-GalNAc-alpha-(1->3)-diNAcBac-PP-undecaprenol alpha-1,4-N-acetyl-D-galactosaminyltransferase